MEEKSLVKIEENLPIKIDPQIVLGEAHKAAKALQEVINQKKKKVVFGGEQYLEFEDWQTLGKFYGLGVRTKDAKAVVIGETDGAIAMAEVYDLATGQIVGGAEAYCLRDEPNWAKKPFFQLASMAQTRAGAKALRNRLSWVAVLAGFRPTPAEEMVDLQDKIEKKAVTVKQPKINQGYTDAEVEPIQEGKAKTAFEDMLENFHLAKKHLGEAIYYEILGRHGYEHANQVSKIKEGEKIIIEMREAFRREGKEVAHGN